MNCERLIKTFLASQGSTTAELARKLGYGRSIFYDKYRRNTFSVADLEKIAEAYGCELVIEFKPKR